MKIVFFGTSEFAVTILKKLAASSHAISCVITQPDRKSGRRLRVSASPVKQEAKKLNIPLYQPEDIIEKSFIDRLKGYKADFFVVVAYGTILPKVILGIPRFCSLNAHASLLPKYRGAAPVNWAIANGEDKTGVTIIRMNEEMDAGDIILQKEAKIAPSEAAEALGSRLAAMGAGLLMEAMELIKEGKADFRKQDEKNVTFAPKLRKEDGRIDWGLDTADIINRMRGLEPWPGTYSFLDGHMLKIISAKAETGKDFSGFLPGELVASGEKEGFIVRTGDGAVSIREMQLEGKKRMSAELFLRGYKIKPGSKLG